MTIRVLLVLACLVPGCAPFDDATEGQRSEGGEEPEATQTRSAKAGGVAAPKAGVDTSADSSDAASEGDTTFECGVRRCERGTEYCRNGVTCQPLKDSDSCSNLNCGLPLEAECIGSRTTGIRVSCL